MLYQSWANTRTPSPAQLDKQLDQLAELDAHIEAVGGIENWNRIEALKLERFNMEMQAGQSEDDEQWLYNEIGIITERLKR